MMSQVKNSNRLFIAVLTALAVSFSGCKGKVEPVNPYVTPGNLENPDWVITGDNDMTVSMTAVVRVSFTDRPGTLAAFIGNDCCGIAEYKEDLGLYWLYISSITNDQSSNSEVQLRFYSPDLKRIFDASETFPFRNDTQLGTVDIPYAPDWIVAE